jgi:hypothetical protein
MKKVIVDADMLPYSCGFASKGEPLSHTLQLVKKALLRIREETGVEDLVLYIKGEGNFREEVAFTQGYKATRSAPKPDTYDEIRQYLVDQWGATKVDGMEADDMVSMLLWQDYICSGKDKDMASVILSSPDKDLKNTPGWHHFPRTGEVKWISEYQAERHFYYQMLEGDNVDNIKGLPFVAMSDVHTFGLNKQANTKGCGKASAKKLMDTQEAKADPELFVWERYMKWGFDSGMSPEEVRDYFIEQGQLLWMTRELNDLLEPVLYQPDEAKYEEAAERIFGEGSFPRFEAQREDEIFTGGVPSGSSAQASNGDDSEWESFLDADA